MKFEIIFDQDGQITLPDLPAELLPVIHAFGVTPEPVDLCFQDTEPLHLKARRFKFHLAVDELPELPLSSVAELHQNGMHRLLNGELETLRDFSCDSGRAEDKASLLDIKIELARRALMRCDLCEFSCGVDRWQGQPGICGSGRAAQLSRLFVNYSEEKELTPAITLDLVGCNWHCVYCQYPDHLEVKTGQPVDPEWAARHITHLWSNQGGWLHCVGGNPDQHLWSLLSIIRYLDIPIRIVWNSNGYMSSKTLEILSGMVDFYLVDFRHWDDSCCQRYGVPPGSAGIIRRNLIQLAATGAGVILRHLQLPGHFECCTQPILSWLADQELPLRINLMHGQYRPAHLAYRFPEINRRLSAHEIRRTENHAQSYGLSLV